MFKGRGVISSEILVLQYTIVTTRCDERIVVDKSSFTREEGEGDRPVYALMFKRESSGKVSRSKKVRDD